MCRFLLLKTIKPKRPAVWLDRFASMAKNSQAYDGSWQGDGWGIAWLDKNSQWQVKKSLLPIWEDQKLIIDIPETTTFAIHARSASFSQQKNILDYNQPYVNNSYTFVFNGFLKGVSLSDRIAGQIGSQKIWSLLQGYLAKMTPKKALIKICRVLLKNSQEVQALNIGLADSKNIYALCYYSKYPRYYQLKYCSDSLCSIICSEKLDGDYSFKSLTANEVIRL